MSIDILSMRRYDADDRAIDIALPVLAIECEAAPPMENYLDAYEEAVLSLVSLGLSAHGIAHALCATESLVGEILSKLEAKEYTERERGKPWKPTQKGEKYLSGIVEESAASESQYGYMFVNAIKKEVLPFFYQGDVGRISLFSGEKPPLKITMEGDEKKTFVKAAVKQFALKKAYQSFYRNLEAAKDYKEGAITKEEAVDIFAGLESFDEKTEEEETVAPTAYGACGAKKNMFIRASNKPPKRFYLQMRIIMDPGYPGGYRAESPFELGGMDNDYFLRQIQWLEQSENICLYEEAFQEFLEREICKLRPPDKGAKEDFQVFIIREIPLLKILCSRFPYVYEDMARIHGLIQRENSLLDRENIVSNLARKVLESLFNAYFRQINPDMLIQIQQRAFDDMIIRGAEIYARDICTNIGLREDALLRLEEQYLRNIIGKLHKTYGNSILEKFINMLVIAYYGIGAQMIGRFLTQPDIDGKYRSIDTLNRIRRKVSHDMDEHFTNDDYELYMTHVFVMINSLLEPFREER